MSFGRRRAGRVAVIGVAVLAVLGGSSAASATKILPTSGAGRDHLTLVVGRAGGVVDDLARTVSHAASAGGPEVTLPSSPRSLHGVPCVGDGRSGPRVELLYAHVKGQRDRYKSQVGYIRTLAAQANGIYLASAAETRGVRQLRFRTNPDCSVWVGDIALSNKGMFGGPFTSSVLLQMWMQTHGYAKKHHTYLVFKDGKAGQCGESTAPSGNPVKSKAQYGDLKRSCWEQRVVGHEITHSLGAVQKTAPNNSDGWHCNDGWDLMCYNQDATPRPFLECGWQHYISLDCHHNDYFSTRPKKGSYLATHWNVARSKLLTRGAPANDSFARPIPASVWCQTCSHANAYWYLWTMDQAHSAVGANLGAGAQTGEPSTAGQSPQHSVWFKVTAPASGALTVDTARSSFDTVLGVYRGSGLGSLTLLGENDDATVDETTSRVVVPSVTKGSSYYVKVDGKGGATGEVLLHVWVSASPGPVITSISPTSAPTGVTLTITGTNLMCPESPASYELMLNGVEPGTFVSRSDTEVSLQIPAHDPPFGFMPGLTGPIVYDTPCGIAISRQNFTLTK